MITGISYTDMYLRPHLAILVCLLLGNAGAVLADSPFDEGNRLVKAELVIDRSAFQQFDSNVQLSGRVGALLTIEKGWHIYWENSGEAGQSTSFTLTLPNGWSQKPIRWPLPYKFLERGDIITYGYENELFLSTAIFSPQHIESVNDEIPIKATISWLVCKDICVPGRQELSLNVPFSSKKKFEETPAASLFKKWDETVPSSDLYEKQIEVETTLVTDQTIALQLRISGLPRFAAGRLAKDMQVFPRETSHVGFGVPKLRLEDEFAEILIPLAQRAGTKPQVISLSGVLGLSADILQEDSDGGLEWQFDLPRLEAEKLPKTAGSVNGIPLELREEDHSQSAKKERVKTVPTSNNTEISLLFAIASGLLAGLILNLMPCVLPVLSIKMMSLSLHKDLLLRERTSRSLAYLSGIEVTFIALALLVFLLRTIGMEVGWGFQFQHPEFVFGLGLVVLLFALGFFDLYFITLPGSSKLNEQIDDLEHPLARSFGEGILVTLLSTPCTAPYLGTALAFAFAQPTFISLIIFLAIGLGLASPYMLVAMIPQFANVIPKPGRWMNEVRVLMGFLLLGTVIWLLFVLESLIPGSALPAISLFLWISFLVWLSEPLGDFSFLKERKSLRILISFVAIGISIVLGAPFILNKEEKIERISSSDGWGTYSPEIVARLAQDGKYVFVDFTADWCISCKFNERFTLNSDTVQKAFSDLNITPLKADWTDGDKVITDALEKYGAHGVPLYVLLSPDGRTKVLPTILTPSSVVEAAHRFVKRG